jgi:hypothetical protein
VNVPPPDLLFPALSPYLDHFITAPYFHDILVNFDLRVLDVILELPTLIKKIGVNPFNFIEPIPLILDGVRRK